LQPQSQSSAAVNAAVAEAYGRRGRWPVEVVPLLREATGLLAMPLLGTASGAGTTSNVSRLFSRDLTLAALADQLQYLSAVWCSPGGSLRLVDSRADREFEGFSTHPQAKQFKVQQNVLPALYNAAQAKVQPPSAAQRGIMGQQAAGQPQAADAAGLLHAAAVEAVWVVASSDYRPTQDEQTRQSDAAALIQRSWRGWRRRQEEVAAVERQRNREEDAIRLLREGMSLQLRISLKVYFTRLRRSLDARKQQEAQAAAAAAGAAGGVGEDGQGDEFGFAATERYLQQLETHPYIDEASCPVCQPKHLAQQQQQLALQQQQQRAQEEKGQNHEGGLTNSASAAPNVGPPAAVRQLPSLNVAVADFAPHKSRIKHIEAVELFRKCCELYRQHVVPLMRWARELMAALENVRAEASRDEPDKFMVFTMESSMALEGALEQLCQQVRQVLADRLWKASEELLAPKWYECKNACLASYELLMNWKSAYDHAMLTHPTAFGRQENWVPRDQQLACMSTAGADEIEAQSALQQQKPQPNEVPIPRLLLQQLHGQHHPDNGNSIHSEQHRQQQRHETTTQQQEMTYQPLLQAQHGNAQQQVQQQVQQQFFYAQEHQRQQQNEAWYPMSQSQFNEPQRQWHPPQHQHLQRQGGWGNAWSMQPGFLHHNTHLQEHHHQLLPVARTGSLQVLQVPGAVPGATPGRALTRPVMPSRASYGGARMQGHQAFASGGPPTTAVPWVVNLSNPQYPLLRWEHHQYHQHRALCDELPPGLNLGGSAASAVPAAGAAMAYTNVVSDGGTAIAGGGSGLRIEEELMFPEGLGGDDGGRDLDIGVDIDIADDLGDEEYAEDRRLARRRRNRYKNGNGGGGRKGGGGAGAANATGIPSSPGPAAGLSTRRQQQQQQQQVPAVLRGNAFAPLIHGNATLPRQNQGKKGRK
ncbi:hypothetical protein VaNZ11_011865, partial [Volvox africanus]